MPEMTLCHIVDDSTHSILLKKASRGVSKGKWNGVGGRIEPKETPYEGAVREAYEESGLLLEDLLYHGKMIFHFANGTEFLVHIFSTHNFEGNLRASDEGELAWFKVSEIPYDEMWDDDQFWLTLMLQRGRFDAEVYFNENGIVKKITIDRRLN